MKENLKNITKNSVYRKFLCINYQADEKRIYFYRRNNQYKSWKHNRKTQYKNEKNV